jgi:hypothetical protein
MKKLILTLSLMITPILFAASDTGILTLRGTVPEILDLLITPEPIALSLPLNTTQVNTKVSTLSIESNSNTGYKLSFDSANDGKLVHSTDNASFIVYTMKLDLQSVNLNIVDELVFLDTVVNTTKDLLISYTGVPHKDLRSGDYSDTITITLSSN